MRFWLANTVRELRENAGVSLEEVSARSKRLGGPGHSQVSRFENHEGWPREFDMVVSAYAAALGFGDARDLWQLSLDRWREYGTVPREDAGGANDGAPHSRVRQLIADQAARDRARSQPSQPGTSTSKAKRRAAGG